MKSMMNVHAAKTNFSKLLARVARGEEIVIAKDGVPVAKLVQYEDAAPRQLGTFAGEMWIADNAFDETASELLTSMFEASVAPARTTSARKTGRAAKR